MTYKYLYQDKANRNCEGEIKARNRADAYTALRKQGIRPYRVIGDDPWNWRPWAIGAGYAILMMVIVIMAIMLTAEFTDSSEVQTKKTEAVKSFASDEEALRFREMAEEAIYRAPEAYRYAVWLGVNARLKEKGLEPIPRPEGLQDDF